MHLPGSNKINGKIVLKSKGKNSNHKMLIYEHNTQQVLNTQVSF